MSDTELARRLIERCGKLGVNPGFIQALAEASDDVFKKVSDLVLPPSEASESHETLTEEAAAEFINGLMGELLPETSTQWVEQCEGLKKTNDQALRITRPDSHAQLELITCADLHGRLGLKKSLSQPDVNTLVYTANGESDMVDTSDPDIEPTTVAELPEVIRQISRDPSWLKLAKKAGKTGIMVIGTQFTHRTGLQLTPTFSLSGDEVSPYMVMTGQSGLADNYLYAILS